MKTSKELLGQVWFDKTLGGSHLTEKHKIIKEIMKLSTLGRNTLEKISFEGLKELYKLLMK